MKLRAERAQLLEYPDHAAYVLENQTASTSEAVNRRLAELAPPAVVNAEREAADLQALIDAEGGDFTLAAWDWAYYTEKVRQARYDFDEACAPALKAVSNTTSAEIHRPFILALQSVVDRSHEIALGGFVLTPRLGLVPDRTKVLNAL